MVEQHELDEILSMLGTDGPPSRYESDQLEFKEPTDNTKKTLADLADAAVCFANASGGTIVFGVNDKARTRRGALAGVPPAYSVDVVRRGIFDRTSPSITAFADERLEAGVRLIVIEVPAGLLPHSNSAGLATRRLGTECRPFPADEQREVMIARGQLDWSAQASGVAPKKLAEIEFARLRRLLRAAGREELAHLHNSDLLAALRLLADDGTVTNAGVLLLADEQLLRQTIPGHEYSYQYRPTPGSEATFRMREARPLLDAIDRLLTAVTQRLEMLPLNVAGGVQLQLWDYPERAVREVLVNALIHRAYDAPGSVDLEHSPEDLTILSPGGLIAGITPANILTHSSTPRHRLLSEAISFAQLAEKTGQGIDRAYREMLRVGKQPPAFEDSGFSLKAVLPGGIGNDAFVRFINDLPEELSRDVDVLLALSLLRAKTSITAQQLSGEIQRSPAEAERVLARLASDDVGLLEPTRRTVRHVFPSYRLRGDALAALSRAVTYRRRTLDQIDAKVVEHVREYGFITNRTIQRLFDMHVYAARDLLTDLRKRGILEKQGSARGGPGVKYSRGENFPAN
jgi:ATP-dependent DNA helicase RecG